MEAQENWHPLVFPCGPGSAPRFGPTRNGGAPAVTLYSYQSRPVPTGRGNFGPVSPGIRPKPSCWVDMGCIYSIITHFPCFAFPFKWTRLVNWVNLVGDFTSTRELFAFRCWRESPLPPALITKTRCLQLFEIHLLLKLAKLVAWSEQTLL